MHQHGDTVSLHHELFETKKQKMLSRISACEVAKMHMAKVAGVRLKFSATLDLFLLVLYVLVEFSDDDLDDTLDLPRVQDILHIWDDEDKTDMDYVDKFIDYDKEDGAGAMSEGEREARRKETQRL
jgi:hypothetical protein